MENRKVVAFWDIYDSTTGSLLESQYKVYHNPMPAAGELVVGIHGKPQAIVKDFQFKGSNDNLPYYNVYV
jgi:hypothetical protein